MLLSLIVGLSNVIVYYHYCFWGLVASFKLWTAYTAFLAPWFLDNWSQGKYVETGIPLVKMWPILLILLIEVWFCWAELSSYIHKFWLIFGKVERWKGSSPLRFLIKILGLSNVTYLSHRCDDLQFWTIWYENHVCIWALPCHILFTL